MQHCNVDMRDWSYHEQSLLEEKIPHFYCTKCGAHFWKDKWYDANEWFFFINGVAYEESTQLCFDFDSPHAHELINHSSLEE